MPLMSIINLANSYVPQSLFTICLSIVYAVFWGLINQVRGSIRFNQPSNNRGIYPEGERNDDLTSRLFSATLSVELPTTTC